MKSTFVLTHDVPGKQLLAQLQAQVQGLWTLYHGKGAQTYSPSGACGNCLARILGRKRINAGADGMLECTDGTSSGADDIFAYIYVYSTGADVCAAGADGYDSCFDGRGRNVNGRERNINGHGHNINRRGRNINGHGWKKIGVGGIMTGADGIIMGEDLKSAGSRAEACAHTITISYKICTYKKKT
jgi:hypothetical protein